MSRGKYSPAQIDQIRHDTKITSIVGRYVIWDKKKSKPGRGDMWACCPFHGEKAPSFHADDRKGIYHCFGCGAHGDVFRFLTEKTGCTFPDAVAQLGGEKDLIDESPQERAAREKRDQARRDEAEREKRDDEADVRGAANRIWKQSQKLAGTLGEQYFISRGVPFAVNFPSLRFHPGIKYPGRQGLIPAVIAGVQAPDDSFLGIWRIYLGPDGKKNTDVPDAKLGLGAYTEAGGCVRLGNPVGRGNACEGIETGLGISGITGGAPVQACLNTSGLVNFTPPPDMSSLLIWPDGDVDRIRVVNGAEKQIESPGHRAGNELKSRLDSPHFPVSIQPTPKNGADYLDVWNRMNKRLGSK